MNFMLKDGKHYIINGSKCFITNASYAEYHTVFANVVDGSGEKRPSVFMLESALKRLETYYHEIFAIISRTHKPAINKNGSALAAQGCHHRSGNNRS